MKLLFVLVLISSVQAQDYYSSEDVAPSSDYSVDDLVSEAVHQSFAQDEADDVDYVDSVLENEYFQRITPEDVIRLATEEEELEEDLEDRQIGSSIFPDINDQDDYDYLSREAVDYAKAKQTAQDVKKPDEVEKNLYTFLQTASVNGDIPKHVLDMYLINQSPENKPVDAKFPETHDLPNNIPVSPQEKPVDAATFPETHDLPNNIPVSPQEKPVDPATFPETHDLPNNIPAESTFPETVAPAQQVPATPEFPETPSAPATPAAPAAQPSNLPSFPAVPEPAQAPKNIPAPAQSPAPAVPAPAPAVNSAPLPSTIGKDGVCPPKKYGESDSCPPALSECWTPGVIDVDCPAANHTYNTCCFNGCYNECIQEECQIVYETKFESVTKDVCTVEQVNKCVQDWVQDCNKVCRIEHESVTTYVNKPVCKTVHDQKCQDVVHQTEECRDVVVHNPSYVGQPTCPLVPAKPITECKGRASGCWSPGVPDVDCPKPGGGWGLCCFDGCTNTCVDDLAPEPVPPKPQGQCETSYEQQCKPETKKVCQSVPTTECTDVQVTVTEHEKVTDCKPGQDVCTTVQDEVCHQVTNTQCQDDPEQECKVVKKPVVKIIKVQQCSPRYKKVCTIKNVQSCHQTPMSRFKGHTKSHFKGHFKGHKKGLFKREAFKFKGLKSKKSKKGHHSVSKREAFKGKGHLFSKGGHYKAYESSVYTVPSCSYAPHKECRDVALEPVCAQVDKEVTMHVESTQCSSKETPPKCWDVTSKVCKWVPRQQCQAGPEECTTSVVDKPVTKWINKCETKAKQVCKQVTKDVCHQVGTTVCKQCKQVPVTKQECHLVPRQDCKSVKHPQVNRVPKEVCENVCVPKQEQKCHLEPVQKCTPVTTTISKVVPVEKC